MNWTPLHQRMVDLATCSTRWAAARTRSRPVRRWSTSIDASPRTGPTPSTQTSPLRWTIWASGSTRWAAARTRSRHRGGGQPLSTPRPGQARRLQPRPRRFGGQSGHQAQRARPPRGRALRHRGGGRHPPTPRQRQARRLQPRPRSQPQQSGYHAHALGRREDALGATEEAVGLYRRLARPGPTPSTPTSR